MKIGDQTKKVHIDHLLPNGLTSHSSMGKNTTEDWDYIPLDNLPEEPQANVEPPVNNDSPSDDASTGSTVESRRYPQQTCAPVKCFELIEM